MNQIERTKYVVEMYQRLNPDIFVNAETRIKNTSIAKLCESNGGPYQRISKWLEKKVSALPAESEAEETNQLFESVIVECLDLMKERNLKYGQSWKVMKIQSIFKSL